MNRLRPPREYGLERVSDLVVLCVCSRDLGPARECYAVEVCVSSQDQVKLNYTEYQQGQLTVRRLVSMCLVSYVQ